MMQTMGSQAHARLHLWLYVDGEQVAVPANIGIDPERDSMEMVGLHRRRPPPRSQGSPDMTTARQDGWAKGGVVAQLVYYAGS